MVQPTSDTLPADPGFLSSLRDAFDSGDPFDALMTASTIASLSEPDNSPFVNAPQPPDIHQLAEALFQENTPQTDQLLLTWDYLMEQPPLGQFQRKQLQRRATVPSWLPQFPQVKPSRSAAVTSVTGEYEVVAVEFVAPWGYLTFAVQTVYSGIGMIEDAFAFPGPLTDLTERADQLEILETQTKDISLADAKAIIAETVEWTDRYIDAPETETWPACKPLLLWALRQLPDGGVGHEYREYTEEEFAAAVEAFMASPYAEGLGKHAEQHADLLLSLASNYGTGDIRMWSEQLVERMLLDLVPRKVMAGEDYLRPLPKVLEALVRYYHHELGIPAAVTVGTLLAIHSNKREYNRLIKPEGYESSLLELEYGDSWTLDIGEDTSLDSLSTEPLPVENLNTKGIPREAAKRVRAVASRIQSTGAQFFDDPEMVTSSLRILAKLGRDCPKYFLQKTTTGAMSWEDRTAAAVCWVAAKANNWFKQSDPERTTKALSTAFGLKGSPAQRGETIIRRLEDSSYFGSTAHLGDASLLTSSRRHQIITLAELTDSLPR